MAIERILLLSGHFLEREEALKAQKAALRSTSQFKALWPVLIISYNDAFCSYDEFWNCYLRFSSYSKRIVLVV